MSARRYLFAIGLLITAAVLLWFLTPSTPGLDDAYIPLHAAHVVLEGHDAVYDVPALTGATSPPYVALLVVLVAIGLSDLAAIHAGVVLTLGCYLLAIWWFAAALGLRGWRRALLLALATGVGDTYLQVTNGLETGFALAAIVGALAAFHEARIGAVAMFAGVLPWLRPDLSLIGGAILIAILREHPRQWRRVVFIPLAIALPWALWAFLDTGHLIPNTVNAKRVFFAEGCLPLASKLQIFGQGLAAWGALMLPATIIGVPGLFRGRLGRFLVVAAIATLGVFLVQLPGAVFHNHHRYLYPIVLPALLYGSVLALREWSPATLLLLLAASAWPLLSMQSDRANVWRTSANELIALREWVDHNVPADAGIATHDAGVLSLTGRPLIDLVGLKTPSTTAAHTRWTWSTCGAGRSQAFRAVLADHPADYLVVLNRWNRQFLITEAASAGRALRSTSDLDEYAVFELPAPTRLLSPP